MRVLFSLLFLLVTPISGWSFECHEHVKFGIPAEGDQLLCRTGYAAGYSYSKKAPLWVAYKLTAESVLPNHGRGGDPFEEDLEIPKQYRSKADDYDEPVYDRGHLAPRAAMDFSPKSRDESFLYSNMTPQLPGFNRQGWRYLEGYVRDWAVGRTEVFVVTGAIYEGEQEVIGGGVHVPSAFYKVIYDPAKDEVVACLMPHQKIYKRQIPNFLASVDEIEERCQCDINSLLEDERENVLESQPGIMWETN